ncbi:MAG: glycosyltransferase 87 family protein [Cyclobacteriaceae bacterium]
MLKQKPQQYFLLIISFILYTVIGYGIERHQTLPLLAFYFLLFVIFLLILCNRDTFQEQELKFWISAAIIFRVSLLFSVPALSDDFYRFIWDGRLLNAGYHPFAQIPSYYMTHPVSIPGIDAELYEKLNSKETFTIYPPVSQFIFWLSVVLSTGSVYGSVVVMKMIIFGFELGTIWIFTKLLRHFKQSQTSILIYALNPLVILELTGNLHFEGFMIFFFLLGIFLLSRQKQLASSLAYALSICTKLIPLIFLPLLIRQLPWKQTIAYWAVTGVFTLLFFVPLLNMNIIHGLSSSLGYYFQRFEFNASIYYLVREAGYFIFGFNIIQSAGPVLAVIATILILTISFRNLPSNFAADIDPGLFRKMLWCMLIYLLFTTTLHPWYIITLLTISVFTTYRFPLVWSGLIFLSYAGYTENAYNENLFLVAFEYIAVIAYLLYETVWMNRPDHF